MKVITFYTPEYQGEVDAWCKSCKDHGHEFYVFEALTKGTWRLNCGQKPEIIRTLLLHVKQPVLWVDVDGRFRSPWDLELEESADFAAWFIPNRVMRRNHVPGGNRNNDGIASGTMWFNYTERSLTFLEEWCGHENGQGKWEQQVLGDVWYLHKPDGLRTCQLPQEYCKVFDCRWFEDDHGEVVIEHLQASRKLKKKVNRHGVAVRK